MDEPHGHHGYYPGSHVFGCGNQYKGADLKKSDLEYSIREQNLEQQKEEEEKRTAELQEYKIYVKTKQYAEEVAKEKLGLVNPDEILLKPTE